MILPIYLYGNPILRQKGIYIKENTTELKELIDDMYSTLKDTKGVGLASHQVGKPYKLFIIKYKTELNEVFINPEIIEYSSETDYFKEGCLSLPGISEDIKRPIKIKIKYLNKNFIEQVSVYSGFIARIIQHEFDHTNGMFLIDKMSMLSKKLIRKKLQLILKRKIITKYKTK